MLFLLRVLVELIRYAKHCITWHTELPCFGAPLSVYYIAGAGKLIEEVEGIQFDYEFALEEGTRERGVPH